MIFSELHRCVGTPTNKSLAPLLFSPVLKIKLFDSRGRFVGTRARSTVEALFARGLVTLQRNTKGLVIAAYEVPSGEPAPSPRPNPCRRPMRTRYSFENPEVYARPWDLKRLHGARDGSTYAPTWLWPVFARVVIECLS